MLRISIIAGIFENNENFKNGLKSLKTTNTQLAQCLKITEKVTFNIASEASYVYFLSGQTLIKNAKDGQFWKPEVCSQTALPE